MRWQADGMDELGLLVAILAVSSSLLLLLIYVLLYWRCVLWPF